MIENFIIWHLINLETGRNIKDLLIRSDMFEGDILLNYMGIIKRQVSAQNNIDINKLIWL